MAYKMLQLILCATVLHMALSYDVDPCTDLKNEMKERAKNRTPQGKSSRRLLCNNVVK